jgi:uncharacterized protein (TIGR02996 family)
VSTYLELKGGKSAKFWEITLASRSFTVRWGRIASAGQSKKHSFGSAAEAKRMHDHLVAQKLAKGYRDPKAVPVVPAATLARDAALEAAIRADRDDPAPYEVYADWLQAHGNPLGELIVLQRALDKKKDAARTRRANALVQQLGLPDPSLATVGWRWGMWRWLRLENNADWMDDDFDAVALARRLFDTPMCAALDELRLGVLRWMHNAKDVPAVLDAARAHAWSGELRRLHLGDVDDREDGFHIDMAHHEIGDVGARIAKTFPRLAWLKLHSGGDGSARSFGLAGLALPELVELTIETCSLSKQRLRDLLAAKLPKLERLELWFGSSNQWGDCAAKDVAPLLGGKVFTALRHLGLRNAEIADDLARALPTAAIAPTLETLDLSMGTLGDDGARALAQGAGSFAALRTLDVSESFLGAAGTRALREAFRGKTVRVNDQRVPFDDGERYVVVGE